MLNENLIMFDLQLCKVCLFGFYLFVGESSGGQQDIQRVAGSAGGCDSANAGAAATVC